VNFYPHVYPHLQDAQPPQRGSVARELDAIVARRPRRPFSRTIAILRFAVRRTLRAEPLTDAPVTIRPAVPSDGGELARIGLGHEEVIVAEVGDEIVAGVPLATGDVVAHPLRARRDVVLLLEVRAAQLAA
jgi:hypothetical protein